jgi:hypothetical protein
MDFGKYADYMAMGYSAMALILAAMIAWIYLRFRALIRENEAVAELEAELEAERAAGKAAPREAAAEPAVMQSASASEKG